MARDVHPKWSPLRELAGSFIGRCTPAVLDLPLPVGYSLPPVGVRRVRAGPTLQIIVLGTWPTGRRDLEGAV